MKHVLIISLTLLAACNSKNPDTIIAAELYDYDVEERIKELGIELTEPGAPVANYVNSVKTGNLVFMLAKVLKMLKGSILLAKLGVI